MREFLYKVVGFPILLCYGLICVIPILVYTILCALIYWALNPAQKEYIWSAEKHLFGLIDDVGNLIDSIIQRVFLK